MSAAKHTPGPWHAVNDQIRSEKHQIARAWMMRNGEGLANARLIAAAPELLAALEEVFVIGDRLVSDVYGHEFVQTARAAITKATGTTAKEPA